MHPPDDEALVESLTRLQRDGQIEFVHALMEDLDRFQQVGWMRDLSQARLLICFANVVSTSCENGCKWDLCRACFSQRHSLICRFAADRF